MNTEKDRPELRKIWLTMLNETFDEFIKENIGYSEAGPPICFGSGNNEPFCVGCQWQREC